MSKRNVKPERKTSPDGSKHVYLLVPPVLYDWIENEATSGGFKTIQEKILDVLRTARDAESQEQAVA